MTEAEWLACEEPLRMLELLHGRNGQRKRRLLAAACCRSFWRDLAADGVRRAVEEVERNADMAGQPSTSGLVGLDEIRNPAVGAVYLHREPGAPLMVAVGSFVLPNTWVCLVGLFEIYTSISPKRPGLIVEVLVEDQAFVEYGAPLFRMAPATAAECPREWPRRHADLIRDVFPHPDRVSLTLAPASPDARDLALGAYHRGRSHSGELDRQRLAVLSDALEEAGCTDEAILGHLRSPGPHVRGCWALDLVLGKG